MFIISTTAKKKKKKKPSPYIHTPFGTSRPARPVRHATEKKRKEKRGKTYRVIDFMPLAVQCQWSLCASKRVVGCAVKIVGGTWVGDAHDVGAGGCHCRQDLETVWPLWLLAKREQGRVKMMFGCVLRGCANAQDWEKRKEKMEKTKNKKEKGKKRNAHSL